MSTVIFFLNVTQDICTHNNGVGLGAFQQAFGIAIVRIRHQVTVAAEQSRSAINRTMDIHRSSMANCVQFAINRSL